MRERLIAFNLCHLTLLAIFSVLGFAQDFKPYPGSKVDDKASQQASAVEKGMEVKVYTSSDNFEKVYSFYKPLFKEVASPLPNTYDELLDTRAWKSPSITYPIDSQILPSTDGQTEDANGEEWILGTGQSQESTVRTPGCGQPS